MLEEDLIESLKDLYVTEKQKMIQSVENVIEKNDPRGLEQSIGRRNGFFWESLVKLIFSELKSDQTTGMIMFTEFVELFINNYIEDNGLEEDIECTKHLRAIVKKFFEVSGTEKQDLCDFVFAEDDDNKYAIDTKWRFISNDSKTVRQIAFSAVQLQALGFKPLLLMKRPRGESLASPINRFEKSGWIIKSYEESYAFINKMTGFDINSWLKNVDIWKDLSDYHGKLKGFSKWESNFEF